MAAVNFTPISLYYSTTAAAVPSAGNLVAGELALNTLDEKLYFKNSAGTVKLLASNATSAPVLSLANTNGGTGATAAFTQYGITYASSTTVLATTAAGTSTTVLHGNASGAPTFGAVSLTADVSGVLPTANGGTNLSSFTANGVVYASSSSALTTGSAVTYSAGTFSLSVASAFYKADVPSGSVSYLGDGVSLVSGAGATDSALRFDGTNLLIAYSNTERVRVNSTGAVGFGGANYGTAGQVLTSGGSSAVPTWATPASGVSLSANNTWTGKQSFIGTTSVIATVLQNAAETVNYGASSAPASTQPIYISDGAITYFGANATNNWTINFALSSGVSMNTALSTGQSTTIAILVTNGGTAYYNTSVQVDGTTSGVTTKWQGGTAPTAGNASSIDVYSYTIIKTASATFTVLASQTKFA
jgi:hypothetical protein